MLTITRRTKDKAKNELRRLTVRGTAGEFKSIKLQMESSEDLSDVRVNIRKNATIETDLYLVKRWAQAGVGIYQANPIDVEELLVKDDRGEFKDRYIDTRKNWRHTFNPLHMYEAPEAPAHAGLRTALEKSKPKSFLLMMQIPSATNSNCSFQVEFLSGDASLQLLDVSVEVLPFTLAEPSQELFIWFKGKLDWREPQHYLSEAQYRSQMKDIRSHGFTSISISEVDTELAQRAIRIAEEVGFNRNILLVPPFPELSKLRFNQTTPILYASDELDMHTEFNSRERAAELIGYHQLNSQRAQAIQAKTMSSLVSGATIKRMQNSNDIGYCPNIISLYLNKNKEYLKLANQIVQDKERSIFYYWQCFMEKPNLNRVLSGLYLWKSGAAGISPYCYQHMPQYPNSPFNDFDEWEPDFHEGKIKRPFKDHMTTYPARDGVIPTLQWEGLRDGITDLRYLQTLNRHLISASNSDSLATRELVKSIQSRIDDFLARINLSNIEINSDTEIEPYPDIDATEYDDFRNQMIDDLLLLTDNQAS